MPESLLRRSLDQVRVRLVTVGIAAGSGWALAGALLVLMLSAWADLALDLPSLLRALCGWTSLIFGLALLLRAGVAVLRSATTPFLARRVDRDRRLRRPGVLTGQRSCNSIRRALRPPGPLPSRKGWRASPSSARRRLYRGCSGRRSSPQNRSAWRTARLAACFVPKFGIVAICSPRLVAAQWLRFVDPYGDHPPYSTIELQVLPGDAKVIYGAALDVHAQLTGAGSDQVDHLDLRFAPSNGAPEESIPMFPESTGVQGRKHFGCDGRRPVLHQRGSRSQSPVPIRRDHRPGVSRGSVPE